MRLAAMSALKATVGAVGITIGIGFILAGVEWLLGLVPFSSCRSDSSVLCRLGATWAAYWWFLYAILSVPISVLFFTVLVRYFAPRGERLVASGLVLVLLGGTSLFAGLIRAQLRDWNDISLYSAVSFGVDIGILVLGTIWLWKYRVEA